jgi:enoyl-[acyl-carrier protein] reductase II
MAGQSVGLADKIMPLQGIFDEMVNDAEAEMQKLFGRFCSA